MAAGVDVEVAEELTHVDAPVCSVSDNEDLVGPEI